MPEFDFQWDITWTDKSGWGAIGTAGLPTGDTAQIVLQRTLTSKWFWNESTPDAERIPENEGDGNKGSYVTTQERSGNLEVRLAPYWKDWQDGKFEVDHGFELQPGLMPHVGDRIHFYGVDSGELKVKATSLEASDYPWMADEILAGDYPYAGLDVLSSHIEPDKLAEIWAQIPTPRKTINVVKKVAE